MWNLPIILGEVTQCTPLSFTELFVALVLVILGLATNT